MAAPALIRDMRQSVKTCDELALRLRQAVNHFHEQQMSISSVEALTTQVRAIATAVEELGSFLNLTADNGAPLRLVEDREPTDDEIYNRPGVEGGIGYSIAADQPGSLGENDWRL